mgnify:CR=1 FL=1
MAAQKPGAARDQEARLPSFQWSEALRTALHDLGFVKNPSKVDAERLMDHVMLVGGWYIEDGEYQVSARREMKIIESASDPRSEYFRIMRRENIPAEELMGRRMEIGVVAVPLSGRSRSGGPGPRASPAEAPYDHRPPSTSVRV